MPIILRCRLSGPLKYVGLSDLAVSLDSMGWLVLVLL